MFNFVSHSNNSSDVQNEWTEKTIQHNSKRIQRLRNLKTRNTPLPNLKAKMEAVSTLDDRLSNVAIPLHESDDTQLRTSKSKIQKCKHSSYPVLIGNDVESLFPSIQDVESARMVRCIVQRGDLEIKNFDHQTVLRYIRVNGGKGFLARCGLGKLEPRWKGNREDLIALGGEKTKDPKNWSVGTHNLTKTQCRVIEARTIEIAILIAMGFHLYMFGGKIHLQNSGGPIGLNSMPSGCSNENLGHSVERATVERRNQNPPIQEIRGQQL